MEKEMTPPRIIPLRVERPEGIEDVRTRAAIQSVLDTALMSRELMETKIAAWQRQLGQSPAVQMIRSGRETMLEDLLWEIEWGGRSNEYHHVCPICGSSRAVGHEKTCRLAAALRKGE